MAEYSAVYEDAIDRITSVYSSCSKAEQKLLMDILNEMSSTGYSYTLERVWLSDFREIPVGIDQFLNDPYYLGETNDLGANIYPFWREMMNEVFNAGNRYNEIVISGATRIGKSSTCVTMMAYMLYKLMLYRDPHRYFGKKAISKFTLGFANLTKELALSVGFREFNDTLKASKWFMDHGTVTRSDRNFYYLPEGDNIEIIPASDGAQLLGKQLWCCLVGNTLVETEDGDFRIDKLQYNLWHAIKQHKSTSWITHSVLQNEVTETLRIWIDDKNFVEGTNDHKIMMCDGSYKMLKELNVSDELMGGAAITRIQAVVHEDLIPVYDVINMKPNHNFIIHVGDYHLVVSNCLVDEMNFAKSGIKDIAVAKQHMKGMYDTINARISGTFRLGGEVYGKLFAASSKNQDNDFLSDHLEKQQKAGNEHLYLVDEPQWKILPKRMFSDEVFHFTVGDRYKRGFVIPEEIDDEEHRAEYEKQGYQVIEAPAELRKNFLADYDISLRDIAGISIVGAMGFITQESITPCVAQDRANPFFEDILVIGKDDDLEIADFFHLEVVPQELKYQQMNIHLDLAETHNRTGISGCCVCGNKIIETDEGKKVAMPYLKQIFAVAIEAPRGGRMSFQKVVNFLVYLRQNYFNVGTVTADQYQSAFLLQVLEQQHFDTEKIAVGMNEYIGLRNLIVDQRIELVRCPLQENELISTQRMNNKIHHPEDEGGGHGDVADGLCGSTASLIASGVTGRPPAKNVAAIAAAVNTGKGRVPVTNPMSSSNTVPSRNMQVKPRVVFPKLR